MLSLPNSRGMKLVASLVLAASMSVLFQNCAQNDEVGQALANLSTSADQSSTSPPGPSSPGQPIIIKSGTIDPQCMTSSAYNACVFLKNPVAQNGAPLPAPISYGSDLSALQIYGVNLEGLDTSGFLQNSTINVTIGLTGAQRATAMNQKWKFSYQNDGSHRVSQVMAYFWLSFQEKYMKARTGVMYTTGKGIRVNALNPDVSNNAYWSGIQRNSVEMGIFDLAGSTATEAGPESEAALSADIYLHEMGHGNISYATNGAIENDSNQQQYPGGGYGCNAVVGCASAINEGQADFHSAIIFPTKPALGEAVFNVNSGFRECGIVRDVSQLKTFTAQQAYNACGAEMAGEAHLMGRVYASIWWEIYNNPLSNKQEVEKMFSEHIKLLLGSDTFATARTRMLTVDQTFFNGKYANMIRSEFTARGIN